MIRRPPSSPLFPSTTLSRSLPLDLGVRVAQPVGPAEPRARPGRRDAGRRAQVRVPSSEDGVELRATRPVHEHAVLDLVDVDFRPDCAELLLRSEEHTSELQSQSNLVCRLLLEKKKKELENKGHNH